MLGGARCLRRAAIQSELTLLIHAAMSEKRGEASFYVGNPSGVADPSA
jgi:hypothetical protein